MFYMMKDKMDKYEWVGRIGYTSRWYYIRVPEPYGKKLHRLRVRIVVEPLESKEELLKLRGD